MRTTLTEYTDIEVATCFSRMSNMDIKKDFYLHDEVDKSGNVYKWEYVLKKLRAICKNTIDGDGQNKRHYRFASHMTCGRQYSNDSVQGLPNKLRRILTQTTLRDYDIQSAHPSILLHLVREYNKNIKNDTEQTLAYECLKLYVEKRDNTLHKHGINKKEMLIALNSDKLNTKRKTKGSFFSDNEFIISFWKEKDAIFNRFYNNKEFNFETTNTKNPKSSYVNKILCHHENLLVLEACDKIKAAGFDPSILMFDGVMVKQSKDDKTNILDILNKDSYVKWTEKDNITPYEFPVWKEVEYTGLYAQVKKSFEKTHFGIMGSDAYYIECINAYGELHAYEHSHKSFRNHTKPYKYICEDPDDMNCGKLINFFDTWEEDPDRRMYTDKVFNPYVDIKNDPTPKDFYNTFKPFKAKLIRDDELPFADIPCCNWFEEFLKTNICNNDEVVFLFMMKYLAHIIQHPEKSQNICIVIRGEQGCGKDTLIEIFNAMFGSDRSYIHNSSNIDDFYGDFTNYLENTIIAVMNEVKGKDGHDLREKIKDFTTRPINNINKKYQQPYAQNNMADLFMFTNNLNIVKIEESDRRLNVLKTSSQNKGNSDYWTDIYKKISNRQMMDGLLTYLYNYDIRGFVAKDCRPPTKEYEALKECGTSAEFQYFNSLVYGDAEDNHFAGFTDYETARTEKCKVIKPKLFMDLGNDWCKEIGCDYKIKASKWKLMLSECAGVQTKFKIAGVPYIKIEPLRFTKYMKSKFPDEKDDDDEAVVDSDGDM